MGCCSSDALPDVPDVIIDDPDVNTTIKAVVKRLGRGRDFSVHKNEYPSNSTEVTQKMWLWFNKSNGGEIFFSVILFVYLFQNLSDRDRILSCILIGVVDLENFVRGWSEEFPKKGKVLWSAKVTERPVFEQFQRVARSDIRDRFVGFFGTSGQKGLHNESQKSGYDSDDDDYYIRHQTHQAKFGRGRRHHVSFESLFTFHDTNGGTSFFFGVTTCKWSSHAPIGCVQWVACLFLIHLSFWYVL